MSRYVVDASVGVKWAVPETHSAEALSLLNGQHLLIVPDLFYVETGNVLWKKARRTEVSPQEAEAAVRALSTVRLLTLPSRPFAAAALRIALETNRPAYDSLYVALAVQEKAPLITADQRLLNALAGSSFASHLLWIGSIPTL